MINYENISTQFKLPIEYTKFKILNPHILNDLEMNGDNNIYNNLFNNNSKGLLHDKWCKFYTTNVKFLKNTNKFLQKYDTLPYQDTTFLDEWYTFKQETSFKEKYSFLEWQHLEFCNRSPHIMQIISMCNLASPAISLCIPILFLIFPFIILKFVQKIPISFSTYKQVLFKQIKNNVIGRFINEFSQGGNWDKKLYVLFGLAFYCFTIYQNVLSCMSFYKNIKRIKCLLYKTKQHICYSINMMDNFISQCKKYKEYQPFVSDIERNKERLFQLNHQLDFIKNNTFNLKHINSVGTLLSNLYDLYSSEEIHNTMCYSFGFLEYINNINGIKSLIQKNKLSKCKFSKRKTKLCNQYYLPLINETYVKNNIDLTNNNYIITGPNASGKTTILKTTIINLLLCQQIGYGCFDKAVIQPYDNFYSYLNIPDTSDRDSLFQAEARRCLEILNTIKEDETKRNFCIFDELYSGTNPSEAIQSAQAYLTYLRTLNSSFLLTTHYYDLCNLEKYNNIKNKYLECISNKNNELEFTYLFKDGISRIKGGIYVLQALQYPSEVLQHLN